MTNNRSCDKKDFDWSIYRKPKRILSDDQELALTEGTMRPLLDYALSQPDVRFDIRHHKANLYFRGGNLLRIAFEKSASGGINHFGEFDLNYSIPKGAARLKPSIRRVELDTEADVAACLIELDRFKDLMLNWWEDYPKGERTYEQYIASANEYFEPAMPPEYMVIDIEYQYARRRFDLVAMRRNPTNTDPVGFRTPLLSLWELKCDKRALAGKSGLFDHAVDYRDFVLKQEGAHAGRAQDEYMMMVQQKVRLELLPDCGFAAFAPARPEYLLLFADYDVHQPTLDRPLAAFLDCLEAAGLSRDVKFADIQRTGERFQEDLTVHTPMSAVEFGRYRTE